MRRREVLAGLGATAAPAVFWALAASAQQDRRVRRIGILTRGSETDRSIQAQLAALREALARLGWSEGRTARFEVRVADDNPDHVSAYAEELVRLAPDIIVVGSLPATRAVLQRTSTIPVVFFSLGDPVVGGLLKNIARPEGNATGVTNQFQSFGGKWLELLKEAAPRTTRIALLSIPGIVVENYFASIDTAADVLGVKAIQTPYRDLTELERAIDAFAAEPNGGLVAMPPTPRGNNSELIRRLALKYRLPTIVSNKYEVANGVYMMSYGSDNIEVVRAAASYADRILRGTKVSELPVQFPTKFELVINLKTAAAIGLTIPESLLFRADEVVK